MASVQMGNLRRYITLLILHRCPRPIRNTEACGFNSAYHVSWSSACDELALQGLNGARSLWHDMSWAFACALCLVCTELGGVKG